jgi:hypothetical protein
VRGFVQVSLDIADTAQSDSGSLCQQSNFAHLAFAARQWLGHLLEFADLASVAVLASLACTKFVQVLARYGTLEQQRRWLVPLLRGDIASCFAMTEPEVASSDATNIQSSIVDRCAHLVAMPQWGHAQLLHCGACARTCLRHQRASKAIVLISHD